jgi:MFS family permease
LLEAPLPISSKKIVYRFAVGCYFFLSGTGFASWASRIPTIKEVFNLNEAELGSVLFLLPLGSISVLPLAGWSISKYGSRLITLLSAIGHALVLLSIAFSDSVFLLSASLFLFGFAGNALNISMNTQALELQEHIYHRPLMSSFHGLWSFGAMFGAIIGGWMVSSDVSMARQYLFLAGFMLLVYLSAYHFLVHGIIAHKRMKFEWPSRALWLLGIICFCCAICEGAMADWSSLYYQQVVNAGQKANTTGYTAFALMMALGRVVGDKLINRFGSRQILLIDSIFIAGGFAVGVGIIHPLAVIIGFGMIGLGVSTIIPIVYTLAGKNRDSPPSVSLAAVTSIGFIGFLAGPPVIGYVAHAIGLRLALLLLIIMSLIITMLSRKVR